MGVAFALNKEQGSQEPKSAPLQPAFDQLQRELIYDRQSLGKKSETLRASRVHHRAEKLTGIAVVYQVIHTHKQ